MSKPVLIGMNNPQGNEAFWPHIQNTSGWRLWQYLKLNEPEVTPDQFREAFDRRNLVDDREWNPEIAFKKAREMWPDLKGRKVVIFGDSVRQAFDLEAIPKVVRLYIRGVELRFLPHPSGRALWYNEQLSREMAALVLHELYLYSQNS